VGQLLDCIECREAAVVRFRFGIGREEPLTRDEIADRLGGSSERVRQIESRVLERMRVALSEDE
jgi:RNA polymerase primary sigma factor